MKQDDISDNKKGLYRKNVGAVLLNKENKIFAGIRFGASQANSWQMPQGGIMEGETEEQALIREMQEEIGIFPHSFNIIKKTAKRLKYTIPEEMRRTVWQKLYIGQEQRWFLVQFTGSDEDINVNGDFPEFKKWAWQTPENLIKSIVYFKRDVYINVFKEFNLK